MSGLDYDRALGPWPVTWFGYSVERGPDRWHGPVAMGDERTVFNKCLEVAAGRPNADFYMQPWRIEDWVATESLGPLTLVASSVGSSTQ